MPPADSASEHSQLEKANALIAKRYHPFSSKSLPDLKAVRVASNGMTFELVILPDMTNLFGSLHGGLAATIIDDCTSITHTIVDQKMYHVSTDLSVSYSGLAKVGETILIECATKSAGNKILFSEASIFVKSADGTNGRLVAFGKHTKFIVESRL
ncbi:Acyl-coenzyme A thioesterase 13 [Podochytrium sp. JEL0797]|nr:Acyl-coenzyme A thioesterase 13 [Podochytrium sp. JEL0797]